MAGLLAVVLCGAALWSGLREPTRFEPPPTASEDTHVKHRGPGLHATSPRACGRARHASVRAADATGAPPEEVAPALPLRVERVHALTGGGLEAPSTGYVLDGPQVLVPLEPIAAEATSLLRVDPLWPEAALDLRVLGPEGRPMEGVSVFRLLAAGRVRKVTTEVLAPGELRIHGIPRLPGEPVLAVLDWGWSEGDEIEVAEEVGDLLERAHVVTRIPEDAGRPWEVEVRLEAARGPALFVVETENDLGYEERIGLSDQPEVEPASLRVTALGWDGAPLPDATIGKAKADAHGLVTLTGLYPGERKVTVKAPGHFPIHGSVTLKPGEAGTLTVKERVGARLEVLVVDAEERPRPSASIAIPGCVVFDVVDGVQRVDMFTDARGRRSFARVEPGAVVVHATWGSHGGRELVTLRDGETTSVTIVAE